MLARKTATYASQLANGPVRCGQSDHQFRRQGRNGRQRRRHKRAVAAVRADEVLALA